MHFVFVFYHFFRGLKIIQEIHRLICPFVGTQTDGQTDRVEELSDGHRDGQTDKMIADIMTDRQNVSRHNERRKNDSSQKMTVDRMYNRQD
jgi:hypothetical protein